MAEVTKEMVKDLRAKTGAGVGDCRKALIETDGNQEKAAEWLREKGIASASKKSARAAKAGIVHSYIHADDLGAGKAGVLLEINCETDFVAKTEDFKNLANEIAMQVMAMAPQYVVREEVPEAVIAKEKELFAAEMKESGKPENVIEKIVEGKINKFYSEVCLMEQTYVKDDKKTVEDVVKESISTIGENIVVKRFTRYVLGEEV